MTLPYFSQILFAVPTAIVLLGSSGPAPHPSAPVSAASSAPAVTVRAGSRPLFNAQSARNLDLNYSGEARAVAALREGARPVSLASADFDADGAPDLVAGYRTAEGGIVTLTRGNPDAFAPADTSLYQKAMQGQMPATFMPTAVVYAIPESPDLMVTGDFNRDGGRDVLVAARGGNLYLLAGDGRGNLGDAQRVFLDGPVRAMAATANGQVAVSVDGEQGPELRILAAGAKGLTPAATFPLPAPGDAVVWANLGGGGDLAIGAGSYIEIIYNALRASSETETVKVPFAVEGLVAGNFIWNRDSRTEIAALAGDGTISILQHGTLDSRPLAAADVPGRRAAMIAKSMQPIDPTSLGPWTIARKVPYAGAAPSGPVAPFAFSSPHMAATAGLDLMVFDGERNQLDILDTSGTADAPSAAVSFSSAPVAALALPVKINGRRDMVVLTSAQASPVIIGADAGVVDPTVNTTADTDGQNACGNTSITASSLTGTISLRTAVCAVNNSGAGTYTISVPPGTYDLTSLDTGELQVGVSTQNVNLSIIGSGTSSDTIIQQTDGHDRIFEIDPYFIGDIAVTIENITLDEGNCSTGFDCTYGGAAILGGGPNGSPDDITLTNTVLSDNNAGYSGLGENGGAMQLSDDGTYNFTNCTFSDNTAWYHGAPQDGGGAGGAINVTNGDNSQSMTITNCTFTGNTAENGGGGAVYSVMSKTGSLNVSGSTFTGNGALDDANDNGAFGGAIVADGDATISNSRIAGNTAADSGMFGTGLFTSDDSPFSVVAINNWWGCNGGPGASGCDTVHTTGTGPLTTTPWLELSVSANPASIETNATSTLTADLTHNSSGTGGFSVPNGTPVTFGGTLDSSVNPTSTTLTNGQQTSTYTAGNSAGTGTGTAKVDNQTVSANIDIGTPPAFTSGTSTTFIVGAPGSFSVTASGTPAPTFSFSGSLPGGVSLTSAGLLSGTPAPGTGGVYDITITASNGFGTNPMQDFTLTVDQAPAFTSATGTTFAPTTSGSFAVTATGYPAPTFGETGAALPGTVTLSSAGILSGTPGAGTGGTYGITITASNGVGTSPMQSFTLTVSPSAMTINWTPVGTIIAGDAGAGVLNASASCGACGSFSYKEGQGGFHTPPVGITSTTALGAGSYTITANFVPTNPAAWSANSAQATLVVSGESVWIVDSGAGGTAELAGNGFGITSSADAGANVAVAIDNAGNVWSVGTGPSALAETSQVGSHASTIAAGTGGLDAPAGIAIDGIGQVWVSNAANNSVSLFTNAGTAVSPTGGITDPSLATPAGIAVDLGGSVWVANTGNSSVTRFLGVAAPVAPLATAAANNTTGARP
jgi:hypothetical protein